MDWIHQLTQVKGIEPPRRLDISKSDFAFAASVCATPETEYERNQLITKLRKLWVIPSSINNSTGSGKCLATTCDQVVISLSVR